MTPEVALAQLLRLRDAQVCAARLQCVAADDARGRAVQAEGHARAQVRLAGQAPSDLGHPVLHGVRLAYLLQTQVALAQAQTDARAACAEHARAVAGVARAQARVLAAQQAWRSARREALRQELQRLLLDRPQPAGVTAKGRAC